MALSMQERLAQLRAKTYPVIPSEQQVTAADQAPKVNGSSDVIDLTELNKWEPVSPTGLRQLAEQHVIEHEREPLEPEQLAPTLAKLTKMDELLNGAVVEGSYKKITLNAKQQLAIETALSGKSFCLIGAAGTGKTTSVREMTQRLLPFLPKLQESTKVLLVANFGCAIVSFTRKAVNNIRRNVIPELRSHTTTMHMLLEFAPNYYETETASGEWKKMIQFEPRRTGLNPLPSDLKVVIYEESSMIAVELYNTFREALPHDVQEIFLGDIQQLPPVFGAAVLGFKMLELPVVELTEVHRQALESPILDLAWKILRGDSTVFSGKIERYQAEVAGTKINKIRVPALDALSRKNDDGEVIFQYWQQSLTPHRAMTSGLLGLVKRWTEDGYYDPAKDIMLCPFNKEFGTIEINKLISNYLGQRRGAVVHEIVAGFERHYLAIGDRMLYDKEDCFIVDIQPNPAYLKDDYMPPSVNLDRWGGMQQKLSAEEAARHEADREKASQEFIEEFLENELVSEIEDRVNQCSHIITIQMADELEGIKTVQLNKAGDLNGNGLIGGYCITVHKFQGSEADNVFLVLHQQHTKMISRELLYTAVTRAKKRLHILCESNSFEKGIKSQRIKGNTLAEKAVQFEGKLKLGVENANLVPRASVDIDWSEVQRMPETRNEYQEQSEDTQASEPQQVAQEIGVQQNVQLKSDDEELHDTIPVSSEPEEQQQSPEPLTMLEKLALLRAKRR